jgi:pimeloyl-ACP methyl ester carboxylesterase
VVIDKKASPSSAARAGVLPHLDVGSGEPVVILHGYGLLPRTYEATARRLAKHCRVIVPALFDSHLRWDPDRVLDGLLATIDALGFERITMIGHSFGGALELEFAARNLDRITEMVFVDTLAMSREWTLAREALHPVNLARMTSPRAAVDFVASWLTHPAELVGAAWWGFTSDRLAEIHVVASAGIRSHVLWADRDGLLSRDDGESFARELHASFTVVHSPKIGPIDHDWMFRNPTLFVSALRKLHLEALEARRAQERVPK